MPSFEDNLNFIFNANYKHGSDFWIAKIDCINTISILKSKISKITAIIKTINHIHGEQLINKSLKNLYNLEKVLKNFEKKTTKAPQKIAFANTEANKLLEEYQRTQNTNTNLELKSSILVDKIKFLYTELYTIKAILNLMKEEFDTIEIRNDPTELPLESLYDKIKKCLKETEEYNILKLKHAQKKFEQSKELNDFMYGKRNPKLAHLLSLDSSVSVDSATPSKLMTPFGPVWIQRSSSDNSRMIYLDQQLSRALKYDAMCEELDWKFNPDFNSEVKDLYRKRAIEGIIKPIIEYINQPLPNVQNSLGNEANSSSPEYLFSLVKYNYPISKYLTKSQKEAAAFLCGVLLLSESHEFRNPTGGKFERKAMQNVLRLAKKGCINPFSKVFSNAKGRYIPAHDERSLKDSKGGKLSTSGGQIQAQNIIDMSIKNIGKLKRDCFLFNFCTEAKKYLEKYSKKYNSAISNIRNSKSFLELNTLLAQSNLQAENVPSDVKQILESGLKLLGLTLEYENQSSKILDIRDLPNLSLFKVDPIEKFKNEISRNKKLVNKMMNNSV